MMASTSARRSAAGRPRAPRRSAEPASSSSIRPASAAEKGGTRNVTSFKISMNTPPRPNITTGPNSSSWATPTTVSIPWACSATKHPVDCALGAALPARSVSWR